MRIGTRLSLGFLAIVAVLALVSIIGIAIISKTQHELNTVVDIYLPSIDFMEQADRDYFQLIEAERTQLLLAMQGERDPKWRKAWQENLDQAKERMASYGALARSDEEKSLYAKYLSQHELWIKLAGQVMDMAESSALGTINEARLLSLGPASEAFGIMRESINQLEDLVMGTVAALQLEIDRSSKSALTTLVVLTFFALSLTIALSYAQTVGITRPLKASVGMAESLSLGNLGVGMAARWKGAQDELGELSRAMDSMAATLKEVFIEVKETSGQVATGSAELADAANQMSKGVEGISASSQQLSQGATEQASSAEEVSASVEQMSANIRQNADNATQTEQIATKASKDAIEGASAVRETVDAMRQIAQKIAIIEEIARQTNMLSLNASIEAARAGEHGKGFAVVASEVGKLAERSRSAAGEISALSKQSVDVAERAGLMLDGMVPDIQRTAELVQEISLASREQDSGAQQINKAIAQLDTVIQHNASISEEFSATSEEIAGQSAQVAGTAEELATQAERLRNAVSFFKTGATAPTKPSAENAGVLPRQPKGPSRGALGKSSAPRPALPALEREKPQPIKGGVAIKKPSTAIVPKDARQAASDDDFLEF